MQIYNVAYNQEKNQWTKGDSEVTELMEEQTKTLKHLL
jgi:hypothetical protein